MCADGITMVWCHSSLCPLASVLCTEISTSRDKNFSCVDLIDTPGLVDGDMQVGKGGWRNGGARVRERGMGVGKCTSWPGDRILAWHLQASQLSAA